MTDVTTPYLVPADDGADPGLRDGRRDSMFLAARMTVGGSRPIDIRVRNLSEGGLMAEGAPPMAIGTPVVVELRAIGAVAGRVAWYAEERAGVAFDAPIDPKRARKPVGARDAVRPAARRP